MYVLGLNPPMYCSVCLLRTLLKGKGIPGPEEEGTCLFGSEEGVILLFVRLWKWLEGAVFFLNWKWLEIREAVHVWNMLLVLSHHLGLHTIHEELLLWRTVVHRHLHAVPHLLH